MFQNKLDIFANVFGEVKVAYDVDGNPWFLVNSIGECLEFENIRKTFQVLCSDGKISISDRVTVYCKDCRENGLDAFWESISSGPRDRSPKNFVSEYGVYALIFASRSERAKEFQMWVTHTVLPAINHNGGYILGQENLPEEDRRQIAEQVRDLESLVYAKNRTIAKLKKQAIESDEIYKNLVEENIQLYAQVEELSKTQPAPKQAKLIKVPRGTEYTVDKEGFLQYGEKEGGKYAIRDFPPEK